MPYYRVKVERYSTGVIIMEAGNPEEVKECIEQTHIEDMEVNWLTTQYQTHKGDIKETEIPDEE